MGSVEPNLISMSEEIINNPEEVISENQPVEETPAVEETPVETVNEEVTNDVQDDLYTQPVDNQIEVQPEMDATVPTFEMPSDDSNEVSNEDVSDNTSSDNSVESYAEETLAETPDADFKLPNLETLNEELKDVDEDEDVWKF